MSALSKLLEQITQSLEDLQEILEIEKGNFEQKFVFLKEQVLGFHALQKGEEADSDCEELHEELSDTKKKLEKEETRNKELSQDVDDLNALLGLYVKEAQNRDKLEEEWKEINMEKLKMRIRSLEAQVCRKNDEIDNLQNVVVELRKEISVKFVKILMKDEEIKSLKKMLHKVHVTEKEE